MFATCDSDGLCTGFLARFCEKKHTKSNGNYKWSNACRCFVNGQM